MLAMPPAGDLKSGIAGLETIQRGIPRPQRNRRSRSQPQSLSACGHAAPWGSVSLGTVGVACRFASNGSGETIDARNLAVGACLVDAGRFAYNAYAELGRCGAKNAQKARAALDTMVQAMGGPAWLNMRIRCGRDTSPASIMFAGRGYTDYWETHAWADQDGSNTPNPRCASVLPGREAGK